MARDISSVRTARSVLLASVVAAALTAGCDDDGAGGGSPSVDDLAGKTFVSSSVEGHPMDGTNVTLSFDEDGIAVQAACNTMRGAVTIDDGRLEVGAMAQTMMACADDLAAQDAFLSGFLEAGPTITLRDATLTLSTDDATITADQQT